MASKLLYIRKVTKSRVKKAVCFIYVLPHTTAGPALVSRYCSVAPSEHFLSFTILLATVFDINGSGSVVTHHLIQKSKLVTHRHSGDHTSRQSFLQQIN